MEKQNSQSGAIVAQGQTITSTGGMSTAWCRESVPLITNTPPSNYCIPQELIIFQPEDSDVHKYFFKGTSKEVSMRQLHMHMPLTELEQTWIRKFNLFCQERRFTTPPELYPTILRILLFNWRKFKDHYLEKSWEHVQAIMEWRKAAYPFDDTEPTLRADLEKGVVYWAARDFRMRPLLVIRLARLPRATPPEQFKRLVIFCLEWALRYLLLPGKSETCSVLLDVRGVSLYAFPVSALADMTTALTKLYPFRLNSMWIINDSLIVQAFWNVAKQFLTEVQQQKMQFYRHGFDKALAKFFAAHQLEKSFGGSRDEIKSFYPFPLAPGPFSAGYKGGGDPKAIKDCIKAVDEVTARGVVWENDNVRTPILWTKEVYKFCKQLNVPLPAVPPRHQASLASIGSGIQSPRLQSGSLGEANVDPPQPQLVKKKTSFLERVRMGGPSTRRPRTKSKDKAAAAAVTTHARTDSVVTIDSNNGPESSRTNRQNSQKMSTTVEVDNSSNNPSARERDVQLQAAVRRRSSSDDGGSVHSSTTTRDEGEIAVLIEDQSSEHRSEHRAEEKKEDKRRSLEEEEPSYGVCAASTSSGVASATERFLSMNSKSASPQTPPAAGDRDEGVWGPSAQDEEQQSSYHGATSDGLSGISPVSSADQRHSKSSKRTITGSSRSIKEENEPTTATTTMDVPPSDKAKNASKKKCKKRLHCRGCIIM